RIERAASAVGSAMGCAYYGSLALQGKPRSHVIKHAYFGRPYKDDEVKDAIDRRLAKLVSKAKPRTDVCAATAKILADGRVIGWFQGGSECGPRALGNRSIISDPR